MKLAITHTTTYAYDTPVRYALQQLRLTPRSGPGQTVLNWKTQVTGGEKQLSFSDQFANSVELVKVEAQAQEITIVSQGEVETIDLAGVVGKHAGFAPLWLFKGQTAATAAGNGVRQMAARVRDDTEDASDVDRLHQLSAEIAKEVTYQIGETDSATTAEGALAAGKGVCQDHSHIMIASARHLGYPARYISGYLLMEGTAEQQAAHAWCEIWTDDLGWIGFDVSNGICPDERYVRVATGRDYNDAAPVLGIRRGDGEESLHVSLQVQQ